MTVSKELAKYKSHSVGVQEVRWDRGGTFLWKVNKSHYLGIVLSCSKRSISAVKGVGFLSGCMPYIILRGHWYYICSECLCPKEDNTD
jgi:hypothetical protein